MQLSVQIASSWAWNFRNAQLAYASTPLGNRASTPVPERSRGALTNRARTVSSPPAESRMRVSKGSYPAFSTRISCSPGASSRGSGPVGPTGLPSMRTVSPETLERTMSWAGSLVETMKDRYRISSRLLATRYKEDIR
uniref:Uncharacterized protein n=1 Tax=Candidatus Kentrum sp. LFY TaxID=2126342 RepID=A0A450WSZ4_9GAMM|nr:MAG: hypothetical protein BECKLFY1418C_GA0070996_106818 [Candidatus Kentron sp. LFY]